MKRSLAFGFVAAAVACGGTGVSRARADFPNLSSQDQALWQTYCSRYGNGPEKAVSLETPTPNYNNPLVRQAAEKLGQVADKSFYLYGAMKKAYKLSSATPPAGISRNAHSFLIYLCGEFRDRPTMVQAKLEWTSKLNKLSVRAQKELTPKGFDVRPGQNVWLQMAAETYRPYLTISSQVFNAKRAERVSVSFGKYLNVDGPVDGFTVCETKYVFAKYLAPTDALKTMFDYAKYKEGLPAFAKANCSQAEIEDYYDFRGDSNFKPNSPEGNGMIWYAQAIGEYCESPWKALPQTSVADKAKRVTDQDCRVYFANPFASRWQAAKAGLMTWLFRHTKYDEKIFSNDNANVVILPRKLNPIAEPVAAPFAYRIDVDGTPREVQEFLPEWQALHSSVRNAGAMGFNDVMQLGLGKTTPNLEFAYERLRDAVNRHTDWYNSGWDDSRGKVRTQAYSPFVASSYEMSASDGFTAPGMTVPGEGDGRKHWMFIFRIKGPKRDADGKIVDWSQSNWYNTAALKAGIAIDFSRMWIDETSFGTNGLAKAEKAWDRLGTAVEGEFDSILYLHNISTSGGAITHDGLPGGN